MQYIVEVRVTGADLTSAMAEMRTWFDHQRIEPGGFRHMRSGRAITFRVDFKVEAEAAAFGRAFGGRLLRMTAADLAGPVADGRVSEREI